MLAEAASAAGIDLESLSPEERAQLEEMLLEMAEAQARLASAPAAEVLLNHLGGFYELARIHLSQDPPHFEEAALAIDALTAVLDAVEDRLGPDGAALRDAQTQLQMAFVQLRQRSEPAGTDSADWALPPSPKLVQLSRPQPVELHQFRQEAAGRADVRPGGCRRLRIGPGARPPPRR